MPEPGKLEKMLEKIPDEIEMSGVSVMGMLKVARAVIDVMQKYYEENEGIGTDTEILLGEALQEIPADLDDVRQIDSEEGVC